MVSKIKNRLGETTKNKQSLNMTIIKYNTYRDIDVKFDDGTIITNRPYEHFKNGSIMNNNFKLPNFKDRTGEIKKNTNGNNMKIIKYNSWDNILVEFENGYTTTCAYKEFKNGYVKNPYEKTIYNLGYIGEGKYKTSLNNKNTIQYTYWKNILKRCYDRKYSSKYPTYKDCTTCEEWHNFQNFAQWFDENYYECDEKRMHLDKDILHKGNKIYSPNNCIFVPERINLLFTKNNINRGNHPIGVSWDKNEGKYRATCSTFNNGVKISKYLGVYNTTEEAYHVYKHFKEKHIKQVANEYKNQIPVKLYDALYKYEVEITD